MKVNAFIAVRGGSTRVPFKNFRIINGKPLYEHLTDESLKCKEISNLFINTDTKFILNYAKDNYGDCLNYYLRDPLLGTSDATLDEYVYDFMLKYPSDICIFLNPCSLFLKAETIDNAIRYFIKNNLDSCVASEVIQTHCFYNNRSVNFNFNQKQPRSQDLVPIHAMTSGFFIWNNLTFIREYESRGSANFCGKFESFGVSHIEAIDIDEENDMLLAEAYALLLKKDRVIRYPDVVEKAIKNKVLRMN